MEGEMLELPRMVIWDDKTIPEIDSNDVCAIL